MKYIRYNCNNIVYLDSNAQVYINTPRGSCVGVVLNANHILTSCQCVLDGQNATNPFFVRIIAGDLNLFTPTYRRFTAQATHIYSHPRYNQNTLENDVAVVRVRIIVYKIRVSAHSKY